MSSNLDTTDYKAMQHKESVYKMNSINRRKSSIRSFIEDATPQEKMIVMINWAILLVSLIGGTFTGIFYFYVQIESQLLKSSWRLILLALALIPFVYFEYLSKKETYSYTKENLLNPKSWKTMFWATFGHSCWTVSILISVNYTSIAQSFLFTNLHSIVIVIYNIVMKIPVTRMELIGTLLATSGTFFLASDNNIHSKEGMVDLSQVTLMERLIFGDLVGMLGSIGAAFYFKKNHELKNDMPTYLSVMAMSMIGFLQISTVAVIFDGASLGFDHLTGIFGVFSQDWFLIYVYMVIITGYGGYVCYVIALKFFDPLLVSVVLTMEPVCGAIAVYLLGWQSFPGLFTILGFCAILPGILAVTFGQTKKKQNKHEFKIATPLMSV